MYSLHIIIIELNQHNIIKSTYIIEFDDLIDNKDKKLVVYMDIKIIIIKSNYKIEIKILKKL